MDASASLAALREAQLLPEDDEVSPSILRKCFRQFCLRYHPDKCADNAERYLEFKADFEQLLQADSLVVPSATLVLTFDETCVLSSDVRLIETAFLPPAESPSRKYGYVL